MCFFLSLCSQSNPLILMQSCLALIRLIINESFLLRLSHGLAHHIGTRGGLVEFLLIIFNLFTLLWRHCNSCLLNHFQIRLGDNGWASQVESAVTMPHNYLRPCLCGQWQCSPGDRIWERWNGKMSDSPLKRSASIRCADLGLLLLSLRGAMFRRLYARLAGWVEVRAASFPSFLLFPLLLCLPTMSYRRSSAQGGSRNVRAKIKHEYKESSWFWIRL